MGRGSIEAAPASVNELWRAPALPAAKKSGEIRQSHRISPNFPAAYAGDRKTYFLLFFDFLAFFFATFLFFFAMLISFNKDPCVRC